MYTIKINSLHLKDENGTALQQGSALLHKQIIKYFI